MLHTNWTPLMLMASSTVAEFIPPIMKQTSTSLLHLCTNPFDLDLSRHENLIGSSHSDITAKLNAFIESHRSVRRVIPCSEMNASMASELASQLEPYVDGNIQESLLPHDRRQVKTNIFTSTAGDFRSRELSDAYCADLVKAWAHHVPSSAKDSSMNIDLPSLPEFHDGDWATDAELYNKAMSHITGHNGLTIQNSLHEKNVWSKTEE